MFSCTQLKRLYGKVDFEKSFLFDNGEEHGCLQVDMKNNFLLPASEKKIDFFMDRNSVVSFLWQEETDKKLE